MRLSLHLDEQRGYLFPWCPVLFGTGIAIYFALRFEPTPLHWSIIVVLLAGIFFVGVRQQDTSFTLISLILVLAGFVVVAVNIL